jgi:negative regulator of sigma E activity
MSMSYYTKIDFVSSIPDSKFHINPPAGVLIEHEEHEPHPMPVEHARHEAGFHLLEPSYLPKGFKPAGAVIIPFRDGKIVGLRYTDGVNSVSLFQTPGDKLSPKFIERLQHGPAKSGTEVYTWREGDISLTIVGRISQDEIRKIAGSVK